VNEPLHSHEWEVLPAKKKTSKRKAEEAGLDDSDTASFRPVQRIRPNSSFRTDEMIAISRPVGGDVTKRITVQTQTPQHVKTVQRITVQTQPSNPSVIRLPARQSDLAAEGQSAKGKTSKRKAEEAGLGGDTAQTQAPQHAETAQRITVQTQPSNPSVTRLPSRQSVLAAEGQPAKGKTFKRKAEEAGLVDSDTTASCRPVQRIRPNSSSRTDEMIGISTLVEGNVTKRITVHTQATGITKRVGAAQRITVQIQPSNPSAIRLPSPQLNLAAEGQQDGFTISTLQTQEEMALYFHPTPLDEDELIAATEKGAGNAASVMVSGSTATSSGLADEDVLMKGMEEPMDMDMDGVSEARPEDVMDNALDPVRPTDLALTATGIGGDKEKYPVQWQMDLRIRVFESRKAKNHTTQCTVPLRDRLLYADAVSRELGKKQPFWVSTSL
jgi:hypothetical protein